MTRLRRELKENNPRHTEGGEKMDIRQILCLALVVLTSVSAGMQLGRLLTLWQKETKDRDHNCNQREDEITDIK